MKRKRCRWCGDSYSNNLDKNGTCHKCRNTVNQLMTLDTMHIKWIISGAMEYFKENIEQCESSILRHTALESMNEPLSSLLESDSHSNRIKSSREFLTQYRKIYSILKHMQNIVSHKSALEFADSIKEMYQQTKGVK